MTLFFVSRLESIVSAENAACVLFDEWSDSHNRTTSLSRQLLKSRQRALGSVTACFRALHSGHLLHSAGLFLRLYGCQNVRNVQNPNPVLVFVCLRSGSRRAVKRIPEGVEGCRLQLVRNRPAHTVPVKMDARFSCPHWNSLGQRCVLPWWSFSRKHWKKRAPMM